MDDEFHDRLVSVAEDLVVAFQNRLEWDGPPKGKGGRFTGELLDSVADYEILKNGTIRFNFEDYAEFLNAGTPNPTTADEILLWVKRKFIPNLKKKPKNNKAALRIAENIAAKITKYGPRATWFIDNTISEDLPRILASNGF